LIKLWTFQAENRITHLATLDAESDAVLALAVKDEGVTVIAGYQGGIIKIWDLDSLSCIKSLTPHSFDILTLSIINDDFFSGGANGSIQRWDRSFNQVANWVADNIVLATCSSSDGNQDANGADQLITGGRDTVIKIWDISKRENEPLPGKRGGFQGNFISLLTSQPVE
jgi:di- and tripeptidase